MSPWATSSPSATPPAGRFTRRRCRPSRTRSWKARSCAGLSRDNKRALHVSGRPPAFTPAFARIPSFLWVDALSSVPGAYSPLLLGGGLPIVGGAVFYAFSTSHFATTGALVNQLMYDKFVPVWQRAAASAGACLASSPAGAMPRDPAACPCIDDGAPCTRMGTPLAALPTAFPPYANDICAWKPRGSA